MISSKSRKMFPVPLIDPFLNRAKVGMLVGLRSRKQGLWIVWFPIVAEDQFVLGVHCVFLAECFPPDPVAFVDRLKHCLPIGNVSNDCHT